MRLLDKTFLSEDEGSPDCQFISDVAKALDEIKFDGYNKQYVLRVTVDEVDDE